MELKECPECGSLLSGIEAVGGKDFYICPACGPVCPAPLRTPVSGTGRFEIALDAGLVLTGTANVSGALVLGYVSSGRLELVVTGCDVREKAATPAAPRRSVREPERPFLEVGEKWTLGTKYGEVEAVVSRIEGYLQAGNSMLIYNVTLLVPPDGREMDPVRRQLDAPRSTQVQPPPPDPPAQQGAVEENRFRNLGCIDDIEREEKKK